MRSGPPPDFLVSDYRSVALIRLLRKYAPPLFSAKVPAQGSLTCYNAPGEHLLEHQNYTCLLYVASAFSKTIVVGESLVSFVAFRKAS